MKFFIAILLIFMCSGDGPKQDTTKIQKLNKELTLQQLKIDSILVRKDSTQKK